MDITEIRLIKLVDYFKQYFIVDTVQFCLHFIIVDEFLIVVVQAFHYLNLQLVIAIVYHDDLQIL